LISQFQIDSIGQTIEKHTPITSNRITTTAFTALVSTTSTLILAAVGEVEGGCF
jgi:hypothetical protein